MDKIIYIEDAKAAVRTIIYDYNGIYDNRSQYGVILDAMNRLDGIPPAQPDIIYCKDCKHWKDSDGVYRRGLDAESKCPLNMKEVYEGTFFCGMAKRREDGRSD